MLDLPALGAYLTERHTGDLFRLETLSHYQAASDDEDYRRYLRGEPDPTATGKAARLERLRTDTTASCRWRRVHVLRTPLSDYLRYECEWGYTYNVTAGEDVRILDLATAPPGTDVLLAVGDLFLVDDEHAVQMNYDEAGRFHHAVPIDSALLASYRDLATAAWTLAEPFTAWWARHPEQHRAGRVA